VIEYKKKRNQIKQLYNTTQRNEKHRQTFVQIAIPVPNPTAGLLWCAVRAQKSAALNEFVQL